MAINNYSAIARNVRMSPRKVRLPAALIRGRSVVDALTALANPPSRSNTSRPDSRSMQTAAKGLVSSSMRISAMDMLLGSVMDLAYTSA